MADSGRKDKGLRVMGVLDKVYYVRSENPIDFFWSID
jgi:hypothetical protein